MLASFLPGSAVSWQPSYPYGIMAAGMFEFTSHHVETPEVDSCSVFFLLEQISESRKSWKPSCWYEIASEGVSSSWFQGLPY